MGDKLVVEVARKKRNGKEKIKTLSTKVFPTKVSINNFVTVNKEASQRQVIARNAWLGLK